MNLIIDLGNSLAKFYFFENKYIRSNFIVNYSDLFLKENSDNPIFINTNSEYLLNLFSNFKQLENIIISSVIEFPADFIFFLENKIEGKAVIILTNRTKLPIQNLYESKETLGKDRIAAAVGANFIFPNTNMLIIDAGSAITYEFISEKNEYLGGNISPGLQMRLKALNSFTNKLPLITISEVNEFLEKNDDIIGKNTNSAIINGVFLGLLAEIESYITNFETKYQPIRVILTGGDSIFFDKKIKNKIFAEPNLVAIGLNRILEYTINKK